MSACPGKSAGSWHVIGPLSIGARGVVGGVGLGSVDVVVRKVVPGRNCVVVETGISAAEVEADTMGSFVVEVGSSDDRVVDGNVVDDSVDDGIISVDRSDEDIKNDDVPDVTVDRRGVDTVSVINVDMLEEEDDSETVGVLEALGVPEDGVVRVIGGTSSICTVLVETSLHPSKVVLADAVALQPVTTEDVTVMQDELADAVRHETTY